MTGPLGLDESALLAEWARRVRANNEQAERFREAPERPDFYAPIASSFKVDPRRTNEPALDVLRGMVVPGETWLDIGCGGGRYALPLALAGAEVIGIDPSTGMLATLKEASAEFGVPEIKTIQSRWPMENPPSGDVSFIAHVSYDIAEIGGFVEGMEQAARRLCVAVLLAEAPATQAAGLWPAVHGEERTLLPALPEFLAILLARGKVFSVWLGERPAVGYPSLEAIEGFVRQQLFIEPDGPGAKKMREVLPSIAKERDGKFYLTDRPVTLGIVSWKP
ncbi:MAG: methyltransferase domain-containing protein [Dehalococcoidia bacterium]